MTTHNGDASTELDTETRERIVAAVDAGFADQIAFTQDLVRFPSLRGREKGAQAFIADAYAARGYAVDSFAIDLEAIAGHPGFSPVDVDYADAVNVVATYRPRRESGRSLILNGHMDVVPEGPEAMWKTAPPYEPARDGDWLYGRGSGDMKAGLAANLFALDALRRIGFQPAARVHVQSVVEEECTGNGALACLVEGYQADAAIIPEPEDEKLVRANTGVLWFQVQVSGEPVHVREAGTGANAIEAGYRVIESLKRLCEDWNAERGAYRYFEELDHPINFNVGKIVGGDWASTVAAWCTFDCRIAIYPGDEPAERARQIEAHLARELAGDPFLGNRLPELVWNGFYAKGYVLEEGGEAEALLASAHRAAAGQALSTFVTPGYLDARVFVIYADTPCLVYGPIAQNIHGFDERVSLASVKRVTTAIALFIAEWCGLEPIEGAASG